ncbi:phosphotransferase enzyme family protein [Robertmurraya mangrovi]|nr:phosphotransferase [Bacillus sp. 31A1R]
MLKEIEMLFNEDILRGFCDRYEVSIQDINMLGGFDSFVYEYERDGQDFILKITHSLRRTSNYIYGEVEWLNYMGDNGVRVSRAIPSKQGNLIEMIGDEVSYFMAICYEKAVGELPNESHWNKDLFEEWGRITGQLHRLTKNYQLNDATYKRNEWHEEEHLQIEKYIPMEQDIVLEKSKALINRIKELPKTVVSYGVIHGDIHHLNFYVDSNNHINLFDFDDIAYNYFINDIAVILFYAYWRPLKEHEDDQEFVDSFLKSFLTGYLSENELDLDWLKQLPDFLRLRHLTQYIVLLQSVDLDQLEEGEKDFLNHLKVVIEKDYPIVDFPFEQFVDNYNIK